MNSAEAKFIFIIGMPGSGKTLFARSLGDVLGVEVSDLDECIEEQQKISISEIWDRSGELNFRILERFSLLQQLCLRPKILSLGGGTPAYFDQMNLILEAGHVIYLEASPDVIKSRLSIDKKRPLFEHCENMDQFIESLLNQRRPYYERAHLIVQSEADEHYRLQCVSSFIKQFNRHQDNYIL